MAIDPRAKWSTTVINEQADSEGFDFSYQDFPDVVADEHDDLQDTKVVETEEQTAFRIETAKAIIEAVQPLLEEEKKANQAESSDEWEKWKASIADLNTRALESVRAVVLKPSEPALQWLARVRHTVFVLQTEQGLDIEERSITAAIINESWVGISGWSR